MTTPDPRFTFPWLGELQPLSTEEIAAGERQSQALTEISETNIQRNRALNDLLVEQYNSRNVDGRSPARLLPIDIPVAGQVQPNQQLALDQLVVRRSQLPGVLRTLAAKNYTASPEVPVRDNNDVPPNEVDENVILLRVQRGSVDLDPQQLIKPMRLLNVAGFDASLNYSLPLGYTAKSTDGDVGPKPANSHPTNRPAALAAVQAAGAPITIAVIDTGLTDRPRPDQWLDEITVAFGGRDNNPDPNRAGLIEGYMGHGTFVCGVVRQVEPSAEIRVYGVSQRDIVATDLSVARALLQAVKDGARIVNISLGTVTVDQRPTVATRVALELIADKFAADPVIVVCAGGNNQDETLIYPAAFSAIPEFSEAGSGVRVVAVGGLEQDGIRGADFSSRGDWVDCSATGRLVVSTFIEGTQDANTPSEVTYGEDPWALWSGTSFSAPQVTGAIARTCRERRLTPIQALESLLNSGSSLQDFGQRLQILPVRQ